MVTQMELDLTASEVIIVTMLANLGASVLAGQQEQARELGAMIMNIPESAAVASDALEKLESSLALAKAVMEQELS
jgi:hypothetical protein